jgi:NADH-quinone oxidoreductase subunit C
MDTTAIHAKLLDHFGDEVILGLTEAEEMLRDPFITVAGAKIDKVCLYCKVEPKLGFDFCQSITGLDTGETLTCVYHLYSYPNKQTVVLKASTPRSEPRLPSSVHVWPAADWYEREVYDLFGIDFSGHPDLRRLLLPDDWEGHPLRKDWVQAATYRGIPTTRDNPLDLLED